MGRDETWRESAAAWGYRVLAWGAPVVPERAGHTFARCLGGLAHRRLVGVRTVVAANQARVLGLDPGDVRVRRATREAFRLYARYWYDAFHLPALSARALAARVEAVDLHHVDTALAGGRGMLAVLPHLGNWDVAGRLLVDRGYRVAAVAENLRPPRLAALFERHREQLGMRILRLIDPLAVRREVVRLLADNWVVALLADRSLSGRGIAVEMFGATRTLPVGPASLARASGAPIVVGAVYTLPQGWRVCARPPLAAERSTNRRADVTALSARLATELEHAIAAHPADWHLFQPGWPVPGPIGSRRAVTRRAPALPAAIGRS